ncbi:hypothetical protein [uncultured Pseudoalteromonas sp.]|uniref:hypothetical protein n=1 Tax=uncultured Pseudoalteromonas sp. TaxID=114053 RepID=UPI002604A003|nr:hypothetical protein [uncultured Pseudoalteromonas sp.]
MKYLVIFFMLICCVACTPDVEPQWHMSSRLNYDGQPVNWKSGSVIGCQHCKIQEGRIVEPDGISIIYTLYQRGQWRAEYRESHQARIVLGNNAHVLLVKNKGSGTILLENKHKQISELAKIGTPFILNMGEERFTVVISQFDEPRFGTELSDPLPVKLNYSVLKSQ